MCDLQTISNNIIQCNSLPNGHKITKNKKLSPLAPGIQITPVVRSRDPEHGRRKVPESTTQTSSKFGIQRNAQNIGNTYAKTLNTNEQSHMFELFV